MRVLHCITCLGVGGAEYMLYRHLRQLGSEAAEHTVLSLMPPGQVADLVHQSGARVEALNIEKGSIAPWRVADLRRIVRRCAPDLILGWMYHGNLAASLSALVAGGRTPVVWTIHHSLNDIRREPRLTRAVIRLSARLSSHTRSICYCSRVAARQHEAIGYDRSRTIILPNGVDHCEFAPSLEAGARLRQNFGIPADRLVIGHVARAHPMKDHPTLLRAVAGLVGDGVPVHAVLIGDGHGTGETARLAAEMGIGDRVTAAPARQDIAAVTPGFDVFALSSAWGEAFPLSVSEAMASGVPAVVTDVGDCAWLVGSDEWVVPPSDPETLQAKLAAILLLPPERRRQLGALARERVVRNFSLERYTARLGEICDAAVRGIAAPSHESAGKSAGAETEGDRSSEGHRERRNSDEERHQWS